MSIAPRNTFRIHLFQSIRCLFQLHVGRLWYPSPHPTDASQRNPREEPERPKRPHRAFEQHQRHRFLQPIPTAIMHDHNHSRPDRSRLQREDLRSDDVRKRVPAKSVPSTAKVHGDDRTDSNAASLRRGFTFRELRDDGQYCSDVGNAHELHRHSRDQRPPTADSVDGKKLRRLSLLRA